MPSRAEEPVKQSKSTPYILGSAFLSALILGATLMLLFRGYQWHKALADLRAEPGIEIIEVERAGFIKRRLLGLKDPLAPPADNLLRKHGIAPHTVEIALTEYHSLNTPYAKQRESDSRKSAVELQSELLTAVGDFTDELNRKREADIDRITRMLFESKFPEAMENVELAREGKNWNASGELYSLQLEKFVEEAPAYLVDGTIDFEELIDLTHKRTSALENDIGSFNLLTTDLDGNYVHIDRMIRLSRQYDEVCDKSAIPRPGFRFEIHAANPDFLKPRIDQLRRQLTHAEGIDAYRFLPEAYIYEYSDEGPSIYLKLLPKPAR